MTSTDLHYSRLFCSLLYKFLIRSLRFSDLVCLFCPGCQLDLQRPVGRLVGDKFRIQRFELLAQRLHLCVGGRVRTGFEQVMDCGA